jgi:hypothetical protein
VAAIGWGASCLAFVALARGNKAQKGVALAVAGALVSAAILVMKVTPAVPGSFGRAEWAALGGWCLLGLLLRH